MLLLIDKLGGGVLVALLFRKAALTDTSETAKEIRLIVGALIVGLAIGLVLYLWKGAIWFTQDGVARAAVAFVVVPLLWLAFMFMLQSLNGKFK